jgi:hypothetical protein
MGRAFKMMVAHTGGTTVFIDLYMFQISGMKSDWRPVDLPQRNYNLR